MEYGEKEKEKIMRNNMKKEVESIQEERRKGKL
jgi:hypothetical protein